MIGKEISHYKIIEKLGAGGQGEVYLAEDSRLDRKVALKILPQHLSDRADLRERFEREARAVSSLNHPHICTLYDIGEQDGIHYLVMEHLEGETLAARLTKGALPLEQTLQYAIQIADALDKAHRQGVVHRDLKPGNIMLVKSGAKLLDFGLAKLQATETPTNLSALPTEQASLTAEGTILGTLQYMAPEQLEGKEADSRTDIFAFGAVVYEMATGKKAFEGSSQASLIGAIMQTDPPLMSELQPMTPELLDWVVKRCLAKEPEERVQSAADLMAELRLVTEVSRQVGSYPAVTAPALWKSVIPWSIAVVAVVVVVAATWSSTSPEEPRLMRFAISPPETVDLAFAAFGRPLAISPDGNWIVFTAQLEGKGQLYARTIDDLRARPISGTEAIVRDPFFSADSQFVAFSASGTLKKVPLAGGPVTTLCNIEEFRGGSWGADDTIVFTTTGGLFRVSAAGGEPELLAAPDREKGEQEYRQPEILPGGRAVLMKVQRSSNEFDTALFSLETGEQRILIEEAKDALYAPTGNLVYASSGQGTVMAVPFDLEALEVTGDSVPVLEGVSHSETGASHYAFSLAGTLIYVPERGDLGRLVWVDRDGTELGPAVDEVLDYPRYQHVSPDGKKVVLTVGPRGGGNLWVFDLEGQPAIPLTLEGHSTNPSWSPDGEKVAFNSNRGDTDGIALYWIETDGNTLEPELLLDSPGAQRRSLWSPDGRELIFVSNQRVNGDILALSISGDDKAREVVATDYVEDQPALSQNGRWLAYESDVTGRKEIWVRSYPNPGPPIRLSSNGGNEPVWGIEDSEIFYYEGDKLMAATVKTEPEFRLEGVEMLFEGEYFHSVSARSSYDIGPDGRFLMIKPVGGTILDQTEINVVLNWFEELKRLVPTDK